MLKMLERFRCWLHDHEYILTYDFAIQAYKETPHDVCRYCNISRVKKVKKCIY